MSAKINQQLSFGALSPHFPRPIFDRSVIDIDSVLISDDSTSDISSKFGQIDQTTKINVEG
jgi:hypothetical protein